LNGAGSRRANCALVEFGFAFFKESKGGVTPSLRFVDVLNA
jgi:hypothetical protein